MIQWNNPDVLMWVLALLPLLLITGLMIKRREALLTRMAEKGLWPSLLPGHSLKR